MQNQELKFSPLRDSCEVTYMTHLPSLHVYICWKFLLGPMDINSFRLIDFALTNFVYSHMRKHGTRDNVAICCSSGKLHKTNAITIMEWQFKLK